jgi:hypothetical protein
LQLEWAQQSGGAKGKQESGISRSIQEMARYPGEGDQRQGKSVTTRHDEDLRECLEIRHNCSTVLATLTPARKGNISDGGAR